MPIAEGVYPENPSPGKWQIEHMYQMALREDRGFFRPQDGDDFGLDLAELKETGKVHMRAPTQQLRRRVGDLWGRMSKTQRSLFLLSYFTTAMTYADSVASALEEVVGKELPKALNFFVGFHEAVSKALYSDEGGEDGAAR